MTEPVTYTTRGRIGLIRIENGAVNALGQAVRAGLMDAVAAFEADDSAGIAVIHGGGRLFIGGADIAEFGKTPRRPFLPDVVDRIEACAKPVIAAMHGAALGGGLEVALGCHYRVAMPGTKLGLPEVTLGIIPGAGGTQRTPRLVGLARAMQMVSSGAPMTPEEALEAGLIDRIGDADLLADALAFAEDLLAQDAPARPVSALPRPAPDSDASAAIRETLAKTARGLVSPLVAVEAVEASCETDLPDGLAIERQKFGEMMQTPQREGLIHAFFNERRASQLPEIKGVAPRDVSSIGVVGGGTMGAGIATAALLRGLAVKLIERDRAAADKARGTIAAKSRRRRQARQARRRAKRGDPVGQPRHRDVLRQAERRRSGNRGRVRGHGHQEGGLWRTRPRLQAGRHPCHEYVLPRHRRNRGERLAPARRDRAAFLLSRPHHETARGRGGGQDRNRRHRHCLCAGEEAGQDRRARGRLRRVHRQPHPVALPRAPRTAWCLPARALSRSTTRSPTSALPWGPTRWPTLPGSTSAT